MAMESARRKADPPQIEIGESAWLVCGLLWVVAGALAIIPLTVAAWLGRLILELMLLVHIFEAGYVTIRARTAGLKMWLWFLRTIVLGSFAVFTIENMLRRTVGQKKSA
jgi:hypothetical protein